MMRQAPIDESHDVLDIAGGRPSKTELLGYRDIAIFKNGVTL